MCGMTQEVVMKQQKAEKQKLSGAAETLRKKQQNSSVTVMSFNSSCSTSDVDEQMKYLELVIYIPIFLLGMALNLAALLVFCLCLPKWTESTIYMTSLALMDLLLLLPLPFKMHAANHKWSSQSQAFCSVLENLYFVGIYGSIYMIMCISADRWLAICHPFKAKQLRSPTVAFITSLMVWFLAFFAIFPVTSNFRGENGTDFHCFHRFSETGWSPKVIICLQIFGFLGPALVVVCCSVHTIWTLQESGQRSSKSQACVKIIYSSLSAFLVPFTPSHLAIFLQFLVHQGVIQDCNTQKSMSMFLQTTMCLSNITCCLDAVCYYFIAHEVRSTTNPLRRRTLSTRRGNSSTSEV
ncbi:G-protein coupled receptor 55 [Girardinichthys multiradiatus]|uniref:G-protein coupled receptor 55 n=1 Tax=Girardinichthys multiradiatus TaxID=208333 RepID=UPI001FADE0EE|nr:G-protein coupled receptor 55 [Girardinichthys multiradiatus]